MDYKGNKLLTKEIDSVMKEKGWIRFDSVLENDFSEMLRDDLENTYKKRRDIQKKNGVSVNTDGTSHHILDKDNSFMEFLSRMYMDDYLKYYFEGNYILNSYGGVINMKNKSSYVSNIHRDVRTFIKDVHLMCNMLVMLDDFTLENGATFVLSGSHNISERPDKDEFYTKGDRITGTKGSIVLFDSNLWHAAGKNETDNARRALTLTFTKPFMKQQLDYPRMLGYELADMLSEDLKQVIGYNSRIPANLDEWYQPPEKRLYKPEQG